MRFTRPRSVGISTPQLEGTLLLAYHHTPSNRRLTDLAVVVLHRCTVDRSVS